MVGPCVVSEGEKVTGDCVVAAAKEALGAQEHCRCAQVDLHRGDGGPLGSVMRKASSLTVLTQAVARAWPVRRKWNQRDCTANSIARMTLCSYLSLTGRQTPPKRTALVEAPSACATDDSLQRLWKNWLALLTTR